MTILFLILKIIGWLILLLLLYLLLWPLKLAVKTEGDSGGVFVRLSFLPLLTAKIAITVLKRGFNYQQELNKGAKHNDTLGQVKTFLDAFEQNERQDSQSQTPLESAKPKKERQKENKWQKVAAEHWQELAAGITIEKLNIKIRAGIGDNPAITALLIGGLAALVGSTLAAVSPLFRYFPAPPSFDIKPDYEQTAIHFQVNCIIRLHLGDIIYKYLKAMIIYKRREKLNYVR